MRSVWRNRKAGRTGEGGLEKEYLTKCIRYELGKKEKEGMAEFAKRSGVAMRGIEYL